MRYFDESLIKTLMFLFPNIGLEEKKFPILPSTFICCLIDNLLISGNYWMDVGKRRELFDNIAKSRNFDPLIAENWYKFAKDARTEKVSRCAKTVINFN